jgi:hypothetical protein
MKQLNLLETKVESVMFLNSCNRKQALNMLIELKHSQIKEIESEIEQSIQDFDYINQGNKLYNFERCLETTKYFNKHIRRLEANLKEVKTSI